MEGSPFDLTGRTALVSGCRRGIGRAAAVALAAAGADSVGVSASLELESEVGAPVEAHAGRVAEDVDGADLSGVSGTPTFFVNGRGHHGAYDVDALTIAVRRAGARALARA